jgi:hypothetical protein
MTTSTSSNRHAHPAYRCARASAVLLGIATASSLVASPVAQAATAPKSPVEGICGKISTASVSAIVGYSLPAPTADTTSLKATKANDEISSVVTSCTYGAYTLAALPKDVILDYAVTSRPLTPAEVTKGLSQAQKIKMHIVPYHGLGMTAYYYSFTETGITIQGISGTQGVKEYGAAVYTKTTPESKLASLVQLAEKL